MSVATQLNNYLVLMRPYVNRTYPEERLNNAILAVRNGIIKTCYAAAKEFQVPRKTLSDKLRRLHPKPIGRPTVFVETEERLFADMVETLGDWGFPVTVDDIKDIIAGFLLRSNRTVPRFIDNRPGTDWVMGFMTRTNMTQRMASNIKRARAAVSKEVLEVYYDNIKDIATKVPPKNIFNYEETCFVDNPGAGKVVTRRGKRCIEKVCEHFKAIKPAPA